MDPDRRRRIASEGGRSSHSGRGRDYEDNYEDDYDEDYDEDEGQRVGNRHRGQDWDEDYDDQDEYEDAGYGDEDDYDEDEDDRRGSRYSSRGRSSSGRRSNTSRRGFGSMDPEQRRRIARLGSQATARSHGREFYEDIGRRGGERVREEYGPEFYEDIGRRGGETVSEEYGPEFYSQIGRRGGRARWNEEDNEDNYGRGRSSRRSSSPFNRCTSRSGRRGFAAMPREQVRRIARMGGRARWGEDNRRRGRSNRTRGHGR